MHGFQFLLLNPRSLPHSHVELFNRVYNLYLQQKSPATQWPGDQVSVLLYGDKILGFQVFEYLDLRLKHVWNQSLHDLAPIDLADLRQSHAHLLMRVKTYSGESIAQTELQGLHSSEILNALALRLMDDSKADLAYLSESFEQTQLHAKDRHRQFKNFALNSWVDQLWPLSDYKPAKLHSVQ
ncbi:hypothetical protein [Bdellovibrio sp. NC01]|uniref:hypothetical protein n=1 Tax=Bdellovibrio sp. NC01 TaxID=2220073 RepID=UPI00115B199E|nr:hypothetical protein [Bdellovibrio sp. NC01]QDK37642.1 hypothetical protein DOE51_08635 [Bdellovibrio sp. NC01]